MPNRPFPKPGQAIYHNILWQPVPHVPQIKNFGNPSKRALSFKARGSPGQSPVPRSPDAGEAAATAPRARAALPAAPPGPARPLRRRPQAPHGPGGGEGRPPRQRPTPARGPRRPPALTAVADDQQLEEMIVVPGHGRGGGSGRGRRSERGGGEGAAAAPGRIHFPNKQPELTAVPPRMRATAGGRQLRRHAAAHAPPLSSRACAHVAERGAALLRGKGDALPRQPRGGRCACARSPPPRPLAAPAQKVGRGEGSSRALAAMTEP